MYFIYGVGVAVSRPAPVADGAEVAVAAAVGLAVGVVASGVFVGSTVVGLFVAVGDAAAGGVSREGVGHGSKAGVPRAKGLVAVASTGGLTLTTGVGVGVVSDAGVSGTPVGDPGVPGVSTGVDGDGVSTTVAVAVDGVTVSVTAVASGVSVTVIVSTGDGVISTVGDAVGVSVGKSGVGVAVGRSRSSSRSRSTGGGGDVGVLVACGGVAVAVLVSVAVAGKKIGDGVTVGLASTIASSVGVGTWAKSVLVMVTVLVNSGDGVTVGRATVIATVTVGVLISGNTVGAPGVALAACTVASTRPSVTTVVGSAGRAAFCRSASQVCKNCSRSAGARLALACNA